MAEKLQQKQQEEMDAQRKHAQAMFEQLRNASETQQRALSVQIATLEENKKRQEEISFRKKASDPGGHWMLL